ncbi:hypothetical protein BDR06DRAFT_968987 [Suillus hirtellus]|nr:hypothetical protein BDR06DRAFT_968987 [Suillus hirtellus]
MTPADTANEALDTTLVAMQLLIKQCMLLESGDPEVLRISDEISRHVLLSCTAIVQECSKAGTFQTMLDWTSMIDNDPRIKGHPWFNKTLNYCSCTADEIPILLDSEPLTSTGTPLAIHFAPLAIVPPPTLCPLPMDRDFANSPSQAIVPLLPSPTSMALEPLTLLPVSTVSIPSKYNLFVPGTKNAKTAPKARNRKKRKAEDNGVEEVKLGNIPSSPSWLGKSSQKRSKYVSSDEQNEHTDITSVIEALVTHQILNVPADKNVAPECSDSTEMADESGFWDAETRPVEWGRDSAITTAAEVTCAINRVGVRERMQAKAKAMAAEAVANPTRCSKLHAPKSQVINKMVVNTRSWKMPMPPNWSLSVVEDNIVECEENLSSFRFGLGISNRGSANPNNGLIHIDTTVYAPPHHGNVHLPAWLANHNNDPNISAISRQWTHTWDAFILTGVHSHVGTSASAVHIAETLDPAVLPVNADACIELCSELSTISN